MDGQLVNIDCIGNRVGCIGFGPKKVIVVVGVNKIVKDIPEGIERAKSIAPLNSRRINHGNPCDETCECTECTECTGTNRICNIVSIIDGCYKFPKRISVVVVAEELGF